MTNGTADAATRRRHAEWAIFDASQVVPVLVKPQLQVNASAGDFACGDGSLVGAPSDAVPSDGGYLTYWRGLDHTDAWAIDWSADLTNGAGEVTGTAEGRYWTPGTRTVTGTIVIDDGAASGDCDDSAGAADIYVKLVLH